MKFFTADGRETRKARVEHRVDVLTETAAVLDDDGHLYMIAQGTFGPLLLGCRSGPVDVKYFAEAVTLIECRQKQRALRNAHPVATASPTA